MRFRGFLLAVVVASSISSVSAARNFGQCPVEPPEPSPATLSDAVCPVDADGLIIEFAPGGSQPIHSVLKQEGERPRLPIETRAPGTDTSLCMRWEPTIAVDPNDQQVVAVSRSATLQISYNGGVDFTDTVVGATPMTCDDGLTVCFNNAACNGNGNGNGKELAFDQAEADTTWNVQHFRFCDDGTTLCTSNAGCGGIGAGNCKAPLGVIAGAPYWTQGTSQPWVMADPKIAGRVFVVASDEHPETESGSGGPNHCPDAVVQGDGSVSLRSERSGSGDGRVYVITVTATDDCGNQSVCQAAIAVPQSNSPKSQPLDSGQAYDPTECG